MDMSLADQLANMKVKEEETMIRSTSAANSSAKSFKLTQLSYISRKRLQSESDKALAILRHTKIKRESVNQCLAAMSSNISSKENSLEIVRQNFQVSDKVYAKQKYEEQYKLEPKENSIMSIMQSKNNLHTRDGYVRNPIIHPPTLPEKPVQKKKKKKTYCNYFVESCMVLLFSMFVLFICTTVYFEENQEHRHSDDFKSAAVELKKRIYGQDHAINLLCERLQLNTPSSRVIVLVGGTGVGKSYTVEIIKKNFLRKYAIRQYYPPIGFIKEIELPFLRPNLIVLENLKERDVTEVVNFLKGRKDTNKNRLVTVLAVFNIEHMDNDLTRKANLYQSLNMIQVAFSNEHIDAEIIPYEFLREDTLDKCIIDAMKASKLTLTEDQFNRVKKSLLERNAGCKGAFGKIQMFGR